MDGFSRDKESTTTSIVYTKHIQVGVKRQTARATGGNYPIELTDFRSVQVYWLLLRRFISRCRMYL